MQAHKYTRVFIFFLAFLFLACQSFAFGIKCEPFDTTKSKHDANGYVWIDCRSPEKFTISHETKAINIEINKVIEFIKTNYHDLNTKIIIYHDETDTVCLCCALAKLGYTDITSVAVIKPEGGEEEKK